MKQHHADVTNQQNPETLIFWKTIRKAIQPSFKKKKKMHCKDDSNEKGT